MKDQFFYYVVKILLRDSKPPIWRRVSLPCDITLYDLHNIIQLAMGWNNSHLHAFSLNNRHYSDHKITPEIGIDERTVCINALLKIGSKLSYEYDFGAGWLHHIIVEKFEMPTSDERKVICIKGSKAVVNEDFSEDDISVPSVFDLTTLNKKLENIQV